MALKLKINAAEYAKLSDVMKLEYIADGADFKLDVSDMPDNGPLVRALEREKENAKTSKARQLEIEAELDELKTSSAVAGKDVKTLTEQHTKKLGETKAEYDARLAKRDGFITTTLIDSVASKLAAKIAIPNGANLLLPHIKSRMQVNFEGDEPTTVILGTDGKPSKMTLDELSAEFVANKDYSAIIRASNASGSAASGKNNGSAGKLNNSQTPADLSKASPSDLAASIEAKKAAA